MPATEPRFVETVFELVDALGGILAIAEEFGVTRQAIHNWIGQDEIPQRYHAKLLMITQREGVQWRPRYWDFRVQLRFKPDAEPPTSQPNAELEPVA